MRRHRPESIADDRRIQHHQPAAESKHNLRSHLTDTRPSYNEDLRAVTKYGDMFGLCSR